MKNKITLNRKQYSILLLLSLLVIISIVLFYQYHDYRANYNLLNEVEFIPTDYNKMNQQFRTPLSKQWKYIQLQNVDGKEFLKRINIGIKPQIEYKVYTGASEEVIREVYESGRTYLKENMEKYDLNEKEIDRFVDRAIRQDYPENSIVIERTGAPFLEDTEYTFTFTYKRWNLFNHFFNTSKEITYTMYFKDDDFSHIGMIKERFDFAQASYINSASEYVTGIRTGRRKACKLWSYGTEEKQYKTSTYSVTRVDCQYPEKMKEVVYVTILSSRIEIGKKDFENELKRLNLKEGENLEVVYTHEPK